MTELHELQQLEVDALELRRSNSFHMRGYRGCIDGLTELVVPLLDSRQRAQADVVLFRQRLESDSGPYLVDDLQIFLDRQARTAGRTGSHGDKDRWILGPNRSDFTIRNAIAIV